MGVYSTEAAQLAASTMSVDEAFVNPIQFAIDSHRSDLQLFEALIERDTCNAFVEAGIISVNEADVALVDNAAKKGIVQKIKEIVEKFINWVKNLARTFSDKVLKIVQADKAIWKRYGSLLDGKFDNFKDCPVKGVTIHLEVVKSASDKVEEIITKSINNLVSADQMNEELFEKAKAFEEEIAKDTDAIEELFGKIKNTDDQKTIIEKLGQAGFDTIVADYKDGYKETLGAQKKAQTQWLKQCEVMRKESIKAEKVAKASDNKEVVNRLHMVNTCLAMEINTAKRLVSVMTKIGTTKIAVERANVLALGNWAAKNGKVSESAIEESGYILTECSNDFVEETFAFV